MSTWKHPSLEEEKEEMVRTSEEMKIPLQKLLVKFENGAKVTFKEDWWPLLQNSEAAEPLSEERARSYAQKYQRNYEKIKKGLLEGSKIPSPIVLTMKNGFYCIAGNTRLMTCRALKILPDIWLI